MRKKYEIQLSLPYKDLKINSNFETSISGFTNAIIYCIDLIEDAIE